MKILPTVVLTASLMCTAAAQEPPEEVVVGRYEHNGSTMLLRCMGNACAFTYTTVAPHMADVVQEGAILVTFMVSPDTNSLEGEAFAYTSRCGAPSFPVKGYRQEENGVIFLHGASLIIDPYTCSVVGHTEYSPNGNSDLYFNPLE